MRAIWTICCTLLLASTASAADIQPDNPIVVIGTSHLIRHPEAQIQPRLMESVRASTPAPNGWHVQATGSGGGMAFLCQNPKTLATARRRGELILGKVNFVLLARAPHPNELVACAKRNRTVNFEKLADYKGGLEGKVSGAYLVTARETETPASKRAAEFIMSNRATLFGEPPLSRHFSATR